VEGAEITIYTSGGLQLFRTTAQATECILTLPNKRTCMYNPGTTPSPQKECTFPNDSFYYGYCSFQVDVTSKVLSGVYKLAYNGTDGVVREDIYKLYLLGGKKELFQHSSIIFRSRYEIRALIMNEWRR
jgi:hypothetical protein